MKKYWITGLSALALLLSACTKESADADDALVSDIANHSAKQTVEPSDLPVAIQANLEMYNFDNYVEEAYHAPGTGYEIIMGDEELIYYAQDGRRLEHRGRRFLLDEHGPCRDRGKIIPGDKLPPVILDYIAENYPNHQVRIGKARLDHIAVLLTPRKVLIFDKDGNFVEEAPGFLFCPLLCKPVPVAELPQEIVDYILADEPDADIKRACIRRMDFTTVGVLTPDGPKVYVFGKDNQFLFSRP